MGFLETCGHAADTSSLRWIKMIFGHSNFYNKSAECMEAVIAVILLVTKHFPKYI